LRWLEHGIGLLVIPPTHHHRGQSMKSVLELVVFGIAQRRLTSFVQHLVEFLQIHIKTPCRNSTSPSARGSAGSMDIPVHASTTVRHVAVQLLAATRGLAK
jgi:hypothetical protein